MKLKQLNWGIIGVGDVTEVKSGPAFYKVPNSELVAVMRRDAVKAEDYARRHNIRKWYSNATELIHDSEVDAVYVATPPDSHASYAIEVMRAGKPVYVEKPMARNYAECLEMLKVSEETGMPLFVAYYRRTLPAFLKAKELIEIGTIGKPLTVTIKLYKSAAEYGKEKNEMSWRVFPEVGGAGHFFDLASHQFDYLDFVFGPITEVQGIATNQAGLYPAEDTVSAIWKYRSGVIGSGSWCFVVDEEQEADEMIITGVLGEIKLSCFALGPLIVKVNNKLSELFFENPVHISQNLVEQLVNDLRGVGKCVSTCISAARTSWVLDEIVKDYYKE